MDQGVDAGVDCEEEEGFDVAEADASIDIGAVVVLKRNQIEKIPFEERTRSVDSGRF